MNRVELTFSGNSWTVDVLGRDRFVYRRLADATRRAGDIIKRATPVGQQPGVSWVFKDFFMQEALAVAAERVRVTQAEEALSLKTDEMIDRLAREGLANNDIALVLGITPSRVSQIVKETARWLWGESDPTGEVNFVKLKVGDGWVAGKGRGPLPPLLEFEGQTFVPTGGATSLGNQPWRHTYVLKGS